MRFSHETCGFLHTFPFKENLVTADSFRALRRDGRHVMGPWGHGTMAMAMAGFQVKSASDCLILRGLPDCPPMFAGQLTISSSLPTDTIHTDTYSCYQLLKNSTGKTQSIIDGSAELDFFCWQRSSNIQQGIWGSKDRHFKVETHLENTKKNFTSGCPCFGSVCAYLSLFPRD